MFVEVIGNTKIRHHLKIGELAEVLRELDMSLELKGVNNEGHIRTQFVSIVDVRFFPSYSNGQIAFVLKQDDPLNCQERER